MEEIRNSPFINVEDRISRLPDNLIHHIFSFIDTKYAVQTSLLSKRWIDTWKSLPFLNFDRISFSEENTERFIEFVYMVFMFRDDGTSIQKFGVRWQGSASSNTVIMNVNRWSLFAVKRDVQEISIVIEHQCQYSVYEIPHRLLNCISLRKLEITVVDSDNDIHLNTSLPTSMNLPQLKVLILQRLSVSDVESSKRLFSSCPVLESITIFNCDIQTDNQRNFTVDSVSLKTFEYGCWLNCTMPNIIKLCAPNLEVFTCRSFLTQDYSLEHSSALSSVGFYMYFDDKVEDENAEAYLELPSSEKDVYAKRMVNFLGALSMVKKMELSSGFLEVLSQAPDLLDCQPPRLCKLYHLGLVICPTKSCLRSIAYLLKISPHITQLFLQSKKSNLAEVGDDWEAGLSSPGMLSHLVYLQIDDVEGCDAEFKILSFVLKRAAALEQVFVSFCSIVGSRGRGRQVEQFKDKLKAVPTASSSIEWEFET